MRDRRGFTLVELTVIAPIVILLIGSFIALAVNLTGEVLSSRGANVLVYDVQDALGRIEQDVKLSTTYLAETNIDFSSTKQGYGGTTSAGSTVPFSNVDKSSSGGSSASLILNSLVTTNNPLSSSSKLVYLKDEPNPCSSFAEYSKNRPMSMNIVYFVDQDNTLWRRVIMPSNYATASARCGDAPWQIPTCIYGYNATALTFCKANDERLVSGVSPSDFVFNYYATAASTTPSSVAVNSAAPTQDRNVALQSTPTVEVSITARQTIAGRDVEHTGSVRATRLETNASAIAVAEAPTSAPAAPQPSFKVTDGHIVTVTWPRVAGASSYRIDYQIKANNGTCDAASSGTWTTGATSLTNDQRTYTISAGGHNDRVCVRLRATNSYGSSAYGTGDVLIPLWAPLILQNGWTAYGYEYAAPSYTKTKAGLVMLRGMAKKLGTTSTNEVLAQLPPDYRPADPRLIFTLSRASNVWGRIDIADTGNIHLYTSSTGWTSLETVRFTAATESYTRTYPTLLNSWVNYNTATHSAASYVKDSAGRVVLQGLIKNGTNTDNTPLFTLPATHAPPQYLHLLAHGASSGASGVGVNTSNQVVAKGYSANTYYSISSNYLSASSGVTWNNMTLQNSWTTYAGYATPQYAKASDGVVHLKGLIKGGTTSDGTVITTLPAGFRPKQRLLFTALNSGVYIRVDVHANGNVTIHSATNNGWIALESISFYPEQ